MCFPKFGNIFSLSSDRYLLNSWAFLESILLVIWIFPANDWVSISISCSCIFFWISASRFFTHTSLKPSKKVFPINAIALRVKTPTPARIVFLVGLWIIWYKAWWVSSFIATFLVVAGSLFSFEIFRLIFVLRLTNAESSAIAPITPVAIALIGTMLFSGELLYSYNFWGILVFLEITRVSQVSSKFMEESGFIKLFTRTPSLVSVFARFCVVVKFFCCLKVSPSLSGLIVIFV